MNGDSGAGLIRLPSDLRSVEGAKLDEWNGQLRAGAARLDWTAVLTAPPDLLDRLLAGLSLDADSEALGTESVSDALSGLISNALARVEAARGHAPATRVIAGVVPGRPRGGSEGGQLKPTDVIEPPDDSDDDSGRDRPPTGGAKDGRVLQAISPEGMRQEFHELILADLLGPAGGPEEEVAIPITDRYLLGKLAPQNTLIDTRPAPISGEEPSADAPDGDEPAAEAAMERAIMEPFATVGEDGEESREDSEAAGPKITYPSTIGLSFTVGPDQTAIDCIAEWGRYERVTSETATTTEGEPLRVWKRVPMAGTVRLALREGDIEPPLVPVEDAPEVIIRGRVRRRDSDWAVTLFLENGQQQPKTSKGAAWLFQAVVGARAIDGGGAFVRRPLRGLGRDDVELQALDMLYRDEREFAVGHGTSVDWDLAPDDPENASAVRTSAAPWYDVPRTDAPPVENAPGLERAILGMSELAALDGPAAAAALDPLADAYETWIDGIDARRVSEPGLVNHSGPARTAVEECRTALGRIREGIEVIRTNPDAAAAFAFMNEAMALQRVRGLYAAARRGDPEARLETFDIPKNRSWRPFQLAFILLGLPALADPLHPDRSAEHTARADLLWFPTGGGKTEAYLGLAAFAMAIRRLQGDLGGRTGGGGVCVLMRYTLRLLTLQQFQRASTLVCAMEVLRLRARNAGDARWGEERFRIGLWVGAKMTPNTTDTSAEAVKRLRAGEPLSTGSPHQLTHCPWCGTRIRPQADLTVEAYESGRGLTVVKCGDTLGECPFTARGSGGEGLPVLVVDEEIYRRLPALVIATVDKFAQMPWKGAVGSLFGRVDGVCDRHGYRSPDTGLEEAEFHPKRGSLPTARTRSIAPLRPPDLIIQDELHLISGPLGSMVGLYETAIDALCSFEVDGQIVRPKVIASTATIRRAHEQMGALFGRKAQIFPPHGLDAGNSFFAQRVDLDRAPGRRYLGVMARGERLKAVLIRTYVAALAASQTLYVKYGSAADPYMTLVGYFGSMRELGGTRRLVDDDIQARLRAVDDRGLARRSNLLVRELTSRISSTEIPSVLSQIGVAFDPSAKRSRRQDGPPAPVDVLLATNMVSVGVDVPRLGLMVVDGQPKTSAEYIQATSRVGREVDRPGMVITVFNWARPRDLSHYEQFRHYHATFYQQVEALSVTPFSAGAIDRGLAGVLTGLVRLGFDGFAPNQGADKVTATHPAMERAIDAVTARALLVAGRDGRNSSRSALESRRDHWMSRIANAVGSRVGYKAEQEATALLSAPGTEPWGKFTCLTSLREVEPTVGLVLIDPSATGSRLAAGAEE